MDKEISPRVPCYQCPDREPGCHDRCEKYQSFKRENDAIKERKLKELKLQMILDGRKIDNRIKQKYKRYKK